MKHLTVINDQPLLEPPEDELERIAFQTLCGDCENLIKTKYIKYEDNFIGEELSNKIRVYKCAKPHDGKFNVVNKMSIKNVKDLNPSGYGCPNFKELKITKKEKFTPYFKFAICGLAGWGLMDILLMLF